MKTLYALLIVLLTTSFAHSGTIIRAYFNYDSLGVTDHQIASVALFANDISICEDSTPAIAADGTYSWSCPEQPFPPGDYSFFIRVTSQAGDSTDSAVALGTIPDIAIPQPDMPEPVLERIEIERTEDGFKLTITPV